MAVNDPMAGGGVPAPPAAGAPGAGAAPAMAGARPLTVPRALIIALGGTGRQIVTAIRRRICDRFGGVEEAMPCHQYLYFDTDAGELATAETGIADPPAVNLDPSRKVAITVTGLQAHMDRPQQWLAQYPHLSEWVPEKAVTLGDIAMGAGSVRARGRLGLCWNYTSVSSAIRSALSSLSAAMTLNQAMDGSRARYAHNAQASANAVCVYLVGSIRGGTGSGTLVDMAYILRDLTDNQAAITGVFALPAHGWERTVDGNLRNALGSIWEVNHWSYPDTMFTAKYGQNVVEAEIEGNCLQPFQYLYLISPKRSSLDGAGADELTSTELIETCADALYYELAGDDVSAQAVSRRNDFDAALQDPDYVGNPQYYLSLGVSLIRFPKERAKRACTWYFVARLLDKWVAEYPIFPQDLQQTVRTTIAKRALFGDAMVAELGRHPESATIMQYRLNERVKHAHEIRQAIAGEKDITSFVEGRLSAYQELYLKNYMIRQNPLQADPRLLGDDLRAIVGRYGTALDSLREKVDLLINEWSNLVDMKSMALMQKAVGLLQEHLDLVRAQCERETQTRNNELARSQMSAAEYRNSVEWAVRKRQESLQNLSDTCRSFWVRGLPLSAGPMIQRAITRHVGVCHALFYAIEQAFAWRCALMLTDELKKHVQQWEMAIQTAANNIRQMVQRAEGESDRANQPPHGAHNEELWELGERERQYAASVDPEGRGESPQFEQAVATFLSLVQPPRTMLQALIDMLGPSPVQEAEDMQRKLYTACRLPFDRVFDNVDASERFFQKYPDPATRQTRLRQLFDASRPCMAFGGSAVDWEQPTFQNRKRLFMVGVSPNARQRAQFVTEAQQVQGILGQQAPILDTHDLASIIIRQEVAAFPVCALAELKEMHDASVRSATEAPIYSRRDVADWRPLTQPRAEEQYKAWCMLARYWLFSQAARPEEKLAGLEILGQPLGDDRGQNRTLGFRIDYTYAGRPKRFILSPVPLTHDTAASRSWYGRPGHTPDQRIPKAIRWFLQSLASNRECVKQMDDKLNAHVNRLGLVQAAAVLEHVRIGMFEADDVDPVLRAELGPSFESAVYALYQERNLGKVVAQQDAAGRRMEFRWDAAVESQVVGYEGPGQAAVAPPPTPVAPPPSAPAPPPVQVVEPTAAAGQPPTSEGLVCEGCGKEYAEGQFCSACGGTLRPKQAACSSCGAAIKEAEARFCLACGERLA